MRQGSVRNLQLNPRFNQLGSHFVFELKARAEHVSLAKVAQTFVAAKNFHLTLLRSFLPSLPSLLSLLLLLLRTLLTPCWPILKVQPKFCLPSCPHAHRMQINIQYTSCNDTHRAHSHTHTHTYLDTLWHCNMSRCRIKFCLCLFTCSGRIRFLGFSIAFYHCILIFFFNELLNCLPHVASSLQVRGQEEGEERAESFTFITLSCGCRNLPKKYATSFLILCPLPPSPTQAKFAAQVQHRQAE